MIHFSYSSPFQMLSSNEHFDKRTVFASLCHFVLLSGKVLRLHWRFIKCLFFCQIFFLYLVCTFIWVSFVLSKINSWEVPVWHSRRRIWHCQNCNMNFIPGQGTSTCHHCSTLPQTPKKKKKEEKKVTC